MELLEDKIEAITSLSVSLQLKRQLQQLYLAPQQHICKHLLALLACKRDMSKAGWLCVAHNAGRTCIKDGAFGH